MLVDMKVVRNEPIAMCIPNMPQANGGGTSDYNQLTNKPMINGVIVQGDKKDKDFNLYGANNPETFVFVQDTPSDRWEIVHNLGKRPSITVVDSAGTVVIGEYEYTDENTVVCTFSGAFSGECYLN